MDKLEELYAKFAREKQFLSGVSPRTVKWYRFAFNRWNTLIGQMPDGENIKDFVIRLTESGVEAVTVNMYARAFNSFLTWLHTEGHIPERIRISRVKEGQKPPKTYSEETLKRFLSWRPTTFEGFRLHTMICVAIDTGARVDELLTLKRDSINLDDLFITVLGKGNKQRTIPISVECRKVLYHFLKRHDSDIAFPKQDGAQLSYGAALDQLKSVAAKLGVKGKVGFHGLRHTFATSYLRDGGNLIYLSRLLGHADLQTTRIYINNNVEDLALVHKKTSLLSKLR
ncbi:MAG TPA: tyrosine-type recombinase/integrase [Pyrinomonadaceae bacterium]|nr:tyrosine-type recombinase/integrase [Pyrinomonadaceae bacterium]